MAVVVHLLDRRAHCGLLLLPFLWLTPASAEETVYLRGGAVVKGKVIDRGSTIVVERKHGSITFDRKDVLRIEGDAKQELPPAPEDDLDTVELSDNKVLRGKVSVSADGKEVVITTKDFGEIKHPIEVVKQIRFKGGKPVNADLKPVDDPGSQSLRDAIDKHVTALKDPVTRDVARRELLELAPLAVQYLQGLAAKDKDLTELMEDVQKVRELKTILSQNMEAQVPRLAERLVERDVAKRCEAIKDVSIKCADEVPPLLLHLIKSDDAAAVRNLCVGELGLLKRFEDLAAILRSTADGQLRLAAAFNLGDNGIYAGVPVIIEALSLSNPKLRDLAAEKLRAYFGKEFGFLPNGSEDERKAAIKRIEEWWAAEGPKLVQQSLKAWRDSEVSDEDKKKALGHWRDAHRILDEIIERDRGERKNKDGSVVPAFADKERTFEFERAAHAFAKALEADPSFSAARISRSVVLYENLRRLGEAEDQLRLVLNRFTPAEAVMPRKMALYHLGRIAQLKGDLTKAAQELEASTRLDPEYVEPRVALGDVYLERAFSYAAAAPAGGAGGGKGPEKKEPEKKDVKAVDPELVGKKPEEGKGEDGEKKPEEGKPNPPEGKPNPPAKTEAGLKTLREQALELAIICYRQANELVRKREVALVDAAKDLATPSGPQNFDEGRFLTSVREDRASLERRSAEIYFRLGRAHAARQDERMALESFRAARRLSPDEKRYQEAAALWESLVERKVDAPKK